MLYAFFAPCPLNVFIGVSSISVWEYAIPADPKILSILIETEYNIRTNTFIPTAAVATFLLKKSQSDVIIRGKRLLYRQ